MHARYGFSSQNEKRTRFCNELISNANFRKPASHHIICQTGGHTNHIGNVLTRKQIRWILVIAKIFAGKECTPPCALVFSYFSFELDDSENQASLEKEDILKISSGEETYLSTHLIESSVVFSLYTPPYNLRVYLNIFSSSLFLFLSFLLFIFPIEVGMYLLYCKTQHSISVIF